MKTKIKTKTAVTVRTQRLPQLSEAQRSDLTGRVKTISGSPGTMIGAVLNTMASPTTRFRDMKEKDARTQIRTAVVNVAVSYVGASVDHTSEIVWDGCIDYMRRNHSGYSVSEILEAFSMAVTGRWNINLSPYHGQFSVKLFGEVMNAYNVERNQIRMAIDKSLAEMTEDRLNQAREEKNRAAGEMFKSNFLDLVNKKNVPELDEIPFFWFNALNDAGYLNKLDEDEKRELWIEAGEIARAQIEQANKKSLFSMDDITDESIKGKRESIYKRLLIRQSLSYAIIDED